VGRPDTERLYTETRELYLRGYGDTRIALFAPLEYAYVDSLTNKYNFDDKFTTRLKSLSRRFNYRESQLDFQLTAIPYGTLGNKQKKGYFTLLPLLGYAVSSQISVQIAYRIESHLAHDISYDGKKWRNFAGYADLAVASYRGKKLSLDLGRRRTNWGIARDGKTLMHSAQAMPVDGLFFGYKLSKYLSLHSTVAYLAPIGKDSLYATNHPTENRYFSAHAISVSPTGWLDLTFKESVIYGGAGRTLEPAYVTPLLWYHAEQLNSGIDDNTFLGMEAVVRFSHKFAGYFEYLLDDMQIEKKGASDREPNEYGVIIGANLFDFPGPTCSWEIEYTRVANRTYNQANPRNRYIQHNLPLGYPLGPDNQSLFVGYNNYITSQLSLAAFYQYQQRGEGRIDSPWSTPWLDNPQYKEKFPSGVVEKSNAIGLELYYQKNGSWQCKLSGNFADITNDRNILGNGKKLWRFQYEFICNLPNISWRLEDE
jgi:hypothetical protein